jgi:hypothetical protein
MQMLKSGLRHIAGGLLGLSVFTVLLLWAGSSPAFKLGIDADNWKSQVGDPAFGAALKAMGVQFVVWHISPEEETSDTTLMAIVRFCRKNGLSYLFNTELVNYAPGVAYFAQSDGTYRWDLRPATLEKLRNDPLFLGAVYDEPMLMQGMNGVTVNKTIVLPYFAQTAAMDAQAAYEAVVSKITELSSYYRRYGKKMLVEEVFPDCAHAAARGGALLAPKMLKENYNDLMLYVYAGAARQYGQKELWVCADLWFLDKFPDNGVYKPGGHTPEELLSTLEFAYQWGIDYLYIERASGLMDSSFALSPYGKKVVAFQEEKSGLNVQSWKTFTPAYIVKRFPSGYWGQKYSSLIPDNPYGSRLPHASLKGPSDTWLRWLNKASGGKIPADADNWNAVNNPYYKTQPYKLSGGLPTTLVVDHRFADFSLFPSSTVVNLTGN